jgi:DNA-directed RNA polymerase specialized sigma24 family protein
MKTKNPGFDRFVARYYPAVYSIASRLTDDPRKAMALTREVFENARQQLKSLRHPRRIAALLISEVLRAGLTPA